MRLIDADALQERFEKVKKESERLVDVAQIIGVQAVIDSQPTAYDVDKVMERLEEYEHSNICKTHEHGCPYLTNYAVSCENCGAMGAVEIVKSGGI